ncbi:MAG: 50S ribosomal protein L14 [Candidatus Dojkabacteria bacterium]|nr:MAG: 50S ribosomal protein L14 [Candidatus Dojkabacteria bacterium]
MVQRESKLKVTDNSGGKVAKVIGIPGASKKRWARVGEIVKVSIVQAAPNAAIEAHEVHSAVIVRTRKEKRRSGGSYIRFDDNACVLIDAKKAPKGTRVFGPVARELKDNGFDKIISLAPEVL